MSPRAEAWLASPKALRAALALAVLLAVPSLSIGFYSDDWLQLGFLRGLTAIHNEPWNLYHFLPEGPDMVSRSIREGGMPWWTTPDLHYAFFRPLSSLLFALDESLFGDAPLGYHVHTCLWGIALVAAAAAVLRRSLPPATAGLALLLFTADDVRSQATQWIAARHALVSAVPAFFALAAYVAQRQGSFRAGRWLAPLLFALGLAGGESAVGCLFYFLAYEAVGPTSRGTPWSARLRALAPLLAVFAAYVALYKLTGSGVSQNGQYFDPLHDPAGFLAAAAWRVPSLVGSYFLGTPTDAANVLPVAPFVALGFVALALVVPLARAVAPHLERDERDALRWLLPGAVLALLVSVGGFAGNRLLMVPSLGGSALMAALFRHGFRSLGASGLRLRARRVVVGLFALVFGPLALLAFVGGGVFGAQMGRDIERIADDMELPAARPVRLFVLVASDPMTAMYGGTARIVKEPGVFGAFHILSMAKSTHRITRVGPRTLRIEPLEQPFLRGAFERVFHAPARVFHAGDRVELGAARVRIASETAGEPTAIEVELDGPLEAPDLVWLAYRDGGLRRVVLPALGEHLDIPWSPGPTGMF